MVKLNDDAINRLQITLGGIIKNLSVGGLKRVETEVEIISQFKKAKVTGYWIGDLIRIDINLHDKGQ